MVRSGVIPEPTNLKILKQKKRTKNWRLSSRRVTPPSLTSTTRAATMSTCVIPMPVLSLSGRRIWMCKEQSPQSKTNSGHSTKLQAMGCRHTIHDTKSWQLEEGKQERNTERNEASNTKLFFRLQPLLNFHFAVTSKKKKQSRLSRLLCLLSP